MTSGDGVKYLNLQEGAKLWYLKEGGAQLQVSIRWSTGRQYLKKINLVILRGGKIDASGVGGK